MNTALRHWKEAATLILAAGHRLGAEGVGRLAAGCRSPRGGSERLSHLPPPSSFDYNVLLLKRSGKSGFMPNAYVFPGGMVDSSDFSSDWLEVFKSFSGSPGFGLRSVQQDPESRPPIFATDRLKLGSPIPGEVALRICALRETFEESGVLLVVPQAEKDVFKGPELLLPAEDSGICSSELTKWRTLVNQNPSNFIKMCRELQVLPNIWALHEWGNWLTPKGRPGGTRFDTAFFICCLQEIPLTLQDEKEIVTYQWSTPSDILLSYQTQELFIAPPQFYELSRLCRVPSLNDLHHFSSQRGTEGCEQWMPVVVRKEDHHVSLLPGDRFYPSDSSEKPEVDEGSDDEPKDSHDVSSLHRAVISGPYAVTLQVTITPKHNHLLPVMEPAVSHHSKSQL